MFQNEELSRLQARKAELILQSEANRNRLAEDWHHLSSADFWIGEAHGTIRRHPAMSAALAAAGGIFAMRFMRGSGGVGGISGAIGRISKLATTGVALWRLFRKKE